MPQKPKHHVSATLKSQHICFRRIGDAYAYLIVQIEFILGSTPDLSDDVFLDDQRNYLWYNIANTELLRLLRLIHILGG